MQAAIATSNGGQTPSKIEIATDNKSVSGQAIAPAFCGGTWKQPVYFYATFDKPLKASSIANKAATLKFELTDADKSVQFKVGISSIGTANAKLNLDTENSGQSFDAVKQQSSDVWNGRLNTIQLDLAKPEEFQKMPPDKQVNATNKLTQFYTALYRVYSGPTVFSDVNGEYRSMKQVGRRGDLPVRTTENVANYKFKVDGKDAGYKTHYSGFSMWDTYRSQAQLLAWIAPDEASEMMQSLSCRCATMRCSPALGRRQRGYAAHGGRPRTQRHCRIPCIRCADVRYRKCPQIYGAIRVRCSKQMQR